MMKKYVKRHRLAALITAGAAVVAIAAAACGGVAAPAEQVAPAAELSQGTINDAPARTVEVSGSVGIPAITGDAPPQVEPAVLPSEAAVSSELESPTLSAAEFDVEALLEAQELALVETYERLVPSVVHVITTQDTQSDDGRRRFGFEFPFDTPELPDLPGLPFQRGEGSGFVWDTDGHIVTNQHVVAGASRVTVEFFDGTELEAEVVGGDPDSDIAVLKVEPGDVNLVPVTLGDSSEIKVGQTAIAIGNPFSQDFTMTVGIVSAVGRTRPSGLSAFSIPLVIQHDAPINPGNSGGPLYDRKGNVIGINTQIISQSGGSTGIGFAVPVNTAAKVVPSIISEGQYRHPWLGISATPLFAELREAAGIDAGTRGVLLQQVVPDSPAAAAGLEVGDSTIDVGRARFLIGGDTIVSIDDTPVRDMDDLINFLAGTTRPGDEVVLAVIRGNGEREDVRVTLGERPAR